jgi:hypothetical protein
MIEQFSKSPSDILSGYGQPPEHFWHCHRYPQVVHAFARCTTVPGGTHGLFTLQALEEQYNMYIP